MYKTLSDNFALASKGILIALIALLLSVGVQLAVLGGSTSAHQGSPGTCSMPGGIWIQPRTASWGCGTINNSSTSYGFLDDTRHDHSCVYLKIQRTNGSWTGHIAKSCGSPVAFSPNMQSINARIYRYSPYGNNYLTIF